MDFPYFQFPWLGDGLVIAITAVVHVIISHGVAIGMMTMIFLAEYIGWRRRDERYEAFAKAAVKPTVIIITGLGAMTGVGIWFTTSALVPAGIGSMLRLFFWPWFVEWAVFVSEVVVLLVYYFAWDAWQGPRKKRHIYLGAAYVVLACLSAVLITGILGFMLTSDGWPWGREFWQAFLNPSFVPQLAWRLAESFALGAAFIMAALLFFQRDVVFRGEALRLYSAVLGVSAALMALTGAWWFQVVPSSFKTHAAFAFQMMTGMQDRPWFWTAHLVLMGLVGLTAAVGLLRWRLLAKVLAIPAAVSLIIFLAEFEWVREFIRGPYLMPGYMYANTVLLSEHELFKHEGMLTHAYWYNQTVPKPTPEDQGAFLFAQNCGTCHTIGGRNDIRARFRGRPEDGIFVMIGRTEEMVPFMPAFSGTDDERAQLARFLSKLEQNAYKLGAPARYPPVGAEER
jgi:hypothetical protein